MHRILLFVACIVTFSFIMLIWEEADAARFGKGRSFGGKSFMSKPFAKPAPQAMPSMRQQQAPGGAGAATAAGAGATASRFGGMGGMFGGLLAGTLIGSLLFGGGFQGSGIMDILLIAGLLYLAFKLFGRWRAHQQMNTQQSEPQTVGAGSPTNNSNTAFNDMSWGNLTQGADSGGGSPETIQNAKPTVPEGFDTEDFLHGAKLMYTRLNASWDKRDLDDIAQFTTQAFMVAIREQALETPNQGRTDILLLNAAIVDVETDNDEQDATVYFSVLLRESETDETGATPVDLREVWHFTRNATAEDQWRLNGIQQVEKQ